MEPAIGPSKLTQNSFRKCVPRAARITLTSGFTGLSLQPVLRSSKRNQLVRRIDGGSNRASSKVICCALSASESFKAGSIGLPVSNDFVSRNESMMFDGKKRNFRGDTILCQSLKMEDKYKSLKAKRLLKEMEELRDRGYDKNGRSMPLGKSGKPKRKGNEGKTKSEMDGDHNGIAPWEKRMRINYGDDVEEQDYGLDFWEDDAKNVAAMRGAREFVKKGGGTYGGQFARDVRGSKRTIIDTADIAKLVAERPGTKAQLETGVAGYYEQFEVELLEKGSALFLDQEEVQQRMAWYLESIGVDVEAVDLSKVPGTGEEQEEKVEYLKALGLEQEDIADIIHRWPQLLRLSLRKNIKPVVKYLESNWIAFKQEQMVTLLNKYPQILYHSIELTLQPRIFFLRGVGLTRAQSRDVFLRCPSLFDTRIEKFPSTSLAYMAAIGVEMADMWQVAYGCPEILIRGVNQFFKPRFEALMTHLELSQEEARKALLQTPELLLIDDVEQLKDDLRSELQQRGVVPGDERLESRPEEAARASGDPAEDAKESGGDRTGEEGVGTVDELRESGALAQAEAADNLRGEEAAERERREEGTAGARAGEAATEVGKSRVRDGETESGGAGPSGEADKVVDLNRMIALFGHRLHENGVKASLDRALGPLEHELRLSPDEVRTVLAEYPALLELEPEECSRKIDALRKEGLETADIRRMVVTDPDWLGVDLEGSFIPKLEFLKVEMERSVKELVEFPNFLCYSLPTRISMRHQKAQEFSKSLPLRSLIGCRWATFNTAVKTNEWVYEVDKIDLAEEAWTIDRAYARQRWEPAKIGAGPVGGLI